MSASLRARVTPPWSGDTTTHSSGSMLGHSQNVDQ